MRSLIVIVLYPLFLLHPISASGEPDRGLSAAEKWDKRYGVAQYIYGVEPVGFLQENIERLRKGRALVLAAGEGRNAVYLAEQGFDVLAVDISAEGLAKCRDLAERKGVRVRTQVADLVTYDVGHNQYDLITDFYYYDADLFPKVMAALKPGGFFILQTFSIDQPATSRFGPRNPAFLVKPNQLLTHFADYRVRYYEDAVVKLDEGMHRGKGAVVRLIVEKSPVK